MSYAKTKLLSGGLPPAAPPLFRYADVMD